MAQNMQLFGPREGFLTHRWIISGNKQITDKYYDETKIRTRQKQHHWNTGAKENQQLNPGGPSNRQKSPGPNQLKYITLCRGHH